MKTATICSKWKIPFYITIEPEHNLPMRKRSYAHFVATRQELVAAKCLATEWLLQGKPKGLSLTEFFGGVGLFATIAEKLLEPLSHTIFEIDDRCLVQLHEMFSGDEWVKVSKKDAREAILKERADILSLDFPNFTCLDVKPKGRWRDQLEIAFKSKPDSLIFTDTAVSYFHVHKGRYSEFFGKPLETFRDYTESFSEWLYNRYGYSISRAAYRGRNASYYFCALGSQMLEEHTFSLETSKHGFIWND